LRHRERWQFQPSSVKNRVWQQWPRACQSWPFLNGKSFDHETVRVMGLAFEAVCAALRIEYSDDDVRQAIATKVVELARDGQRNPDALCEVVLRQIRVGPGDSQVA
jgi:hypothetical protein